MKMMHGSVKWFSPKKGYGFILGPEGKEYFCHFSEIIAEGFRNLNRNDEVSFDVKETPKGIVACNITVTKAAPFPSGEKFEH